MSFQVENNNNVKVGEFRSNQSVPSRRLSVYPGSKIKLFDLHSFFFGGVLNDVEGVAEVATQ